MNKRFAFPVSLLFFCIIMTLGCIKADVNADFRVSPVEILRSDTVYFTNYSKNADFLLWDFGDGSTSENNDCTHIYGFSGKYKVTLTASGVNGVDIAKTELEILPSTNLEVHVKNNLEPLQDCAVKLYETKQDRINGTNVVAEKNTGSDGIAFFLNLETQKYYIKAVKGTSQGIYESDNNALPTHILFYDIDNLMTVQVDFHPTKNK